MQFQLLHQDKIETLSILANTVTACHLMRYEVTGEICS